MSNVNEIGKLARYFATVGEAPARTEQKPQVQAPTPQTTEAVNVDPEFGKTIADADDSSKSARVAELKAKYAAGELKASSYDSKEVAKSVITDLMA